MPQLSAVMKSFAIAAALAFAGLPPAHAADYPDRAVTIVVPTPPGGTNDLVGRLVAEGLTKRLEKPFTVENKGGASGNIGTGLVARSAPDGYTLLLAYSGYQVANPALYPRLDWHPVTSFEPIADLVHAAQVVAVRRDFPANTLQEFIAYAKSKPGAVTYASSGQGSIQHIGGEQLSRLAGIEMTRQTYKGAAPAANALVSGQVDVFVTTPPTILGHLKTGAVKVLAIASAMRHPSMPDVPTTAEAGLTGCQLESWFALYAPAGTPKPIVDRLAAEVAEVVRTPEFIAKATENGTDVVYKNPHDLKAFTEAELKKYSELIARTGITLD